MHCNIMQCGNVMLLAAVVATMVTFERYTGADFEQEDVYGPQSN